jgi:prepilin-type N-terminal cleavage/methylation domain-containing protein
MDINFKEKKGFTIIELIISIFILSFALVGIFSAFSIVTILTSDAADRLTGTYLVQEGMEVIRNIRDTNWLNMDCCNSGNPSCPVTCPAKWDDGFSNCESGSCEVDYTTTGTVSNPINPYVGNYLNMNTNSFYVYDSTAPETKFKRKIDIECLPNNDCLTDYIMKVTVQVSWNEKANILSSSQSADDCNIGKNCIKAEVTLYNWYNYVPPAVP